LKKLAFLGLVVLGCVNDASPPPADVDIQDEPEGYQTPVVTNAESPVAYPPDLFDQGIEGTVILRLFVDETGTIHPDSATIVESSGNAQLDTAALRGVGAMRFAPARQDGEPVASTFLQPIDFKNPESTSGSEAQ
jgi:protein TonB